MIGFEPKFSVAVRPLLQVVARTGLREVFTSVALLIVLGVAQLMTMAGLSMGLGAFLAGVLLAGSEFRHALEADIEPFKGLLMGLFFITVGLDLMAVEVNTKAGFRAGPPQRLFAAPPPRGVGWNLAPGGDRFLFVTTPDGGKPAPF